MKRRRKKPRSVGQILHSVQNDKEGRLCPEAFHYGQALAVCVGATGEIVAVLFNRSEGLGVRGSIILLLEPEAVYSRFIHLVV